MGGGALGSGDIQGRSLVAFRISFVVSQARAGTLKCTCFVPNGHPRLLSSLGTAPQTSIVLSPPFWTHEFEKWPGHRPGVPETPGGTNRVYRPVCQGLPVVYSRKLTEKGHFCQDTPRTPGRPGVFFFQKFDVIFLQCLCCVPIHIIGGEDSGMEDALPLKQCKRGGGSNKKDDGVGHKGVLCLFRGGRP